VIIVYHQKNKVVEVETKDAKVPFEKNSITENLIELAEKFPQTFIIWCHISFRSNLNILEFQNIFHHEKIMASYNLSSNYFISKEIGYVETSPFLNINKKVNYPTWQMSSHVGGVHASILLMLKNEVQKDKNFDYFLNSIAKLAMPLGLFCYSEPMLIKEFSESLSKQSESKFLLFRFVKQHYKTSWVFLLFLNLFLYERKFTVFPLLFSLFYKKRNLDSSILEQIEIQSSKKVVEKGTLDIIIPTIGRKKYLYDFLKDLSLQSFLPQNVIIVEQNPVNESVSDLSYIEKESWPFFIKHIFTHKTGACNARNLALKHVTSEWVFMADDDIRIDYGFLKQAFELIKKEGLEQVTFGCYASDYPQSKKNKQKSQFTSFGSGCSILKTKNIENISYNTNFEFGYGEDSDYGMQLRNLGFDITYLPKPEIIHLKAPIGGFRGKLTLPWQEDKIQPKPSPTVMLYNLLNLTKEQLNSYKTTLFFKFYSVQKIKNPFRYYANYQRQWNKSLYWANKLNSQK